MFKEMTLCCFGCSVTYRHPLHRWVHLTRAGGSVKKRLPAESDGRIEGRSLGFRGLSEGASTAPGWGAQSGNQVMEKEFRAGSECDGRLGGGEGWEDV